MSRPPELWSGGRVFILEGVTWGFCIAAWFAWKPNSFFRMSSASEISLRKSWLAPCKPAFVQESLFLCNQVIDHLCIYLGMIQTEISMAVSGEDL